MRGLRQGDPILPSFFTLLIEVLNLMIKRHVRIDKRFQYHYGCKNLDLTHLCFEDDLLLLCHGDPISACIIRRGLDEFSMSSGLYPSLEKSTSFFSNMPSEIKEQIALALLFKEGALPVRYLGLQLIASVLSSLNVYWASMFIIPNHVCESIDKILKCFLWSIDEGKKGVTSVAWKDVCRPKSQGGLGLRTKKLMNEGLMCKYLWNI
ncbi:RNA-directed DNA polymerase, eukaryota, reverse transcriptase zinc-binding domain protein, partial [Tanacetum coccineum]